VVRFPDGKTNIAFTGISDNAFRADSAETALSGVIFLSDHYASAEYRKHLAKVYLKKALQAVS
jgi:carbon-monoxide dehydrogenase medium subunit